MTGSHGPVHCGAWKDGDDLPLLGLQDIAFKTRTRWFIRVMKEILKHLHFTPCAHYGRPFSQAIAMHTGLWAVPWPKTRIDLVDSWISERLLAAARRDGRVLDSLPLASRHDEFPPFLLTTASF